MKRVLVILVATVIADLTIYRPYLAEPVKKACGIEADAGHGRILICDREPMSGSF